MPERSRDEPQELPLPSSIESDNPASGDAFSMEGVRRGMRATVPMGIGVAVYGLVFGLLARQVGLSALENVLMNLLVFAGAAQTASLDVWAYPLPMVSIVVTTLLINLRLILLGAAARPWLHALPDRKVYPLLHVMADEGWAVAMNARRRGERDIGFFLGANLFVALCWLPSIVVGHWLGGGVGDPAVVGLDFAFTTVFAATLFSGYRTRFDLVPWGAAAVAALLAWSLLPGTWYVLVGGVTGFAVGFLFGKPALAPGPMVDGAP